jgi:hypothetical protein
MALFLAIGVAAQAQHAHEGDVIFEYDAGKIIIESGELSTTGPAERFFEGAFGLSGLGNGFTGDPGFEAHDPIGAGDQIGFNIHAFNGNFLHYFDPSTSTLSNTHNHTLTIDWTGAGDLLIGRTIGGTGPIANASAAGVFHHHMEFSLANLNAPNYGAYGFLMSLTTSAVGIAESDPFWMVFNYGMDEVDFENLALPAFGITAVPEPSALMLVSLAACGLAWRRKREEIV